MFWIFTIILEFDEFHEPAIVPQQPKSRNHFDALMLAKLARDVPTSDLSGKKSEISKSRGNKNVVVLSPAVLLVIRSRCRWLSLEA